MDSLARWRAKAFSLACASSLLPLDGRSLQLVSCPVFTWKGARARPETEMLKPLCPCILAPAQPGTPLTGLNMMTVIIRVAAGPRGGRGWEEEGGRLGPSPFLRAVQIPMGLVPGEISEAEAASQDQDS
ncbi:Hypothetical predicted protein [Marmota monax]|uniref:Uncharacterized protein n=1 Tax=Marmota monax TaxID=9995 RepID=A0A5E4D0X2_MARMO|nr:Hypothetical predicted protein [Marmota monax]